MAWVNPKTNWAGADGVAAADMNRIEENERMLRTTLSVYETAGGTGTAITLSNVDLTAGASKTFVAALPNGGAATTINGVRVYMPGSNADPTFVAGYAYTVWYKGVSFFVKASASGNAVAGDLLAGKTASTANGEITGTIPVYTADLAGINQSFEGYAVAKIPTPAYYTETARLTLFDSDFIASKIPSDVNLFGLQGIRSLGKKVASGTVGLSATYIAFYNPSGATSSYYYVEVTGLSFTPKVVVVYGLDTDSYQSVTLGIDMSPVAMFGKNKLVFGIRYSNWNSAYPGYVLEITGNAYLNNGFRLPLTGSSPGTTLNWIAYE